LLFDIQCNTLNSKVIATVWKNADRIWNESAELCFKFSLCSRGAAGLP